MDSTTSFHSDIIVGAPYDGANRRGAIYVYHGKEDGLREEFSQVTDMNCISCIICSSHVCFQVIYAEDVDSGLTTFGFSVGGGKDVDDNEYPGQKLPSTGVFCIVYRGTLFGK